jgi:hypothetical protein
MMNCKTLDSRFHGNDRGESGKDSSFSLVNHFSKYFTTDDIRGYEGKCDAKGIL